MYLDFSSEQLTFGYLPNTHLSAFLTVTNNTKFIYYYKFKLTRPKSYLIKPDRGFIEPSKSIKVGFTLHFQGVKEAEMDKLRCFYKIVPTSITDLPKNWQKQDPSSMSIKIPITIQGLPEDMRRQDYRVKNSQVKSLAHSKFDPSSLESSIKQKQDKVAHLKNSIETLKKGGGRIRNREGVMGYVVVAGVGLVIGVLCSIWI